MKQIFPILFVAICLFFFSCSSSDEILDDQIGKVDPPESPIDSVELPSLTSTEVNDVTATNATLIGDITTTGSSEIVDKGFVWGTSSNPTLSDNKVSLGQGTEAFSTNLQSLEIGTTYYARAYASNDGGTAYGEEITFDTLNGLLVMSTSLLSDDIFHNKDESLLYFTTYERDNQGNPMNPMKISAFDYSKKEMIAVKEYNNITWTDYANRLFESVGYYNGKTELYVIDDFGQIIILDGRSLDVLDTIPSPDPDQKFRSKVVQLNDFLFVANGDNLYVINRNTLELVNTIANRVNERGIIAYNNLDTNEIEVVSFNTFSTNSDFGVLKLDLMGNLISGKSYERTFGGWKDLLKTNDNVDFILTGDETAILWKSDFENQGQQVFNSAKDVLITDDGTSVYVLGNDAILRTYDADNLFATSSEFTVVPSPEKVFLGHDDLIIVEYNFWKNQSEDVIDIWVYYY